MTSLDTLKVEQEGFLLGDDYLSLPHSETPWIIQDLIPEQGVVNIFGAPKLGKSFVALGMALAVANGSEDWNGYKVHRHGPVAYLQIDTPRAAWRERNAKIVKAGHKLGQTWFCDGLLAPYPFNILLPDHVAFLKKEIQKIKPVLTIVDTLREVHAGDENDSTVMKNVVSNLYSCVAGQSALVLVSHTRKASQQVVQEATEDSLMNDARGSSYIAGRMDTVIKITPTSMLYKGRSVHESRVKISQNPVTGLIERDMQEVVIEQKIKDLLVNQPHLKNNAIAKIVQEEYSLEPTRFRTLQRRVATLRGEV